MHTCTHIYSHSALNIFIKCVSNKMSFKKKLQKIYKPGCNYFETDFKPISVALLDKIDIICTMISKCDKNLPEIDCKENIVSWLL